MKKLLRRAASVVVLGTAVLAAGCSGSGGSEPAFVAGTWGGSLTLTFLTGEPVRGRLEMRVDQDGDFAAGVADWTPVGEPQSAAVRVDGSDVSVFLAFWCESGTNGVTLTGSVDGDIMTITGASGIACFNRGPENRVADAEAVLERDPNAHPL